MSAFRDPERKDRPSTSQFSDYEKCRAKYRLQLLAPANPKETEEQSEGTKRHAVWVSLADNDTKLLLLDLDLEGRDVVGKAGQQMKDLVLEMSDVVKAKPHKEYLEHRLWYPGDLYSGRLDQVVVYEDRDRTSLVMDFKSLWGETEPPVLNWQLRADVPLVKHAFGSRRAITAILQPNLAWQPPAFYDSARIDEAEKESVALVKHIDVDDPEATPGEHCARCSAILYCKAAQQMVVAQGKVTKNPAALVKTLPDRTLEHVYRYGKWAEKVTNAAHDELLERVLEKPDNFELYKDARSGDTAEFGDLQKVFNELVDMAGIVRDTPDFQRFLSAFQTCLKPSLPQLVDLMANQMALGEKETRGAIEKRLMLRGLLKLIPNARKLILKHKKWELPE